MKTIRIVPVGGCREIGLNMMLLQVGGSWFFIDCGLLFPDAGAHGIDFVIPDLSHLEAQGIRPAAWLITHGHEDHIGALPYVYQKFPAPIFGSELSLALLQEKFGEHGLKGDFRPWKVGDTIDLGPLVLHPVAIEHSIPDATALVMETELGTLLHTGDFRVSTSASEVLERMRALRPIRLLFADSTNVMTPGWERVEEDLVPEFEEIMRSSAGTVVIVTFASNIWRYGSVLRAARACGRKVHFMGRSMRRNLELGKRFAMLPDFDDLLVDEDEFNLLDPAARCLVCAGSQGEVFSGAYRLASGTGRGFRITPQDLVVFSSKTIPGNEKSVGRLLNDFARAGVRVITASDRKVHVSGHGFREEIRELISAVQPEFFIPVHGEMRHLKAHRELALECGVAEDHSMVMEDGEIVEFDGFCLEKKGTMPVGRVFVSQRLLLDETLFRERRRVARTGMVFAVFPLCRETWRLQGTPLLRMVGLPFEQERVLRELERIHDALSVEMDPDNTTVEAFQEKMRILVRRYLENDMGYKTTVAVDFMFCP